MEPRFGHNFSRVRVHTDTTANRSAQAINALAYTVGQDIFFDARQYRPQTQTGVRLLAHELTHVLQQDIHDKPLKAQLQVNQPSDQWEQEADRVSDAILAANPKDHRAVETTISSPSLAQNLIMPYRPKGSANFGACDAPPTWIEKPFTNEKTEPWIEKISVDFNSTMTDSGGDLVPKGTLEAKYFDNSAKLSNITGVSIVGGAASEGLTDQGSHKVTRIEGCGYDATFEPIPKDERLEGHKRGRKYFKPNLASKANMSFAIFFSGKQAIHEGSLDTGSLACVHVGNTNIIRQLNYHSVTKKTQVKVSYDASALKDLCCERYKVKGYMVSNPCKGQDSKKCP
jgi:hypothetical protein